MNGICTCGKSLCTSRIPLFSNLPIEIQKEVVSKAIHSDKNKNEFLIKESDDITSIRIIREGRVKINRYDKNGKEFILDILTDGETIGEDLFFESSKSPYNAICITDVKLCEISKQTLLNLIASEPNVAWNMIKHLSTKLRHTNNLLEILQENDALSRIAKFLLERSGRIPNEEISLTIDDVAASVNLRKETVSRKFTELQNDHYIKRLGQKRIKIIDLEGLKELL
ncbi:MAG TPA: Crp/Fnr family transcriptional regulator [Candidatus Merdenecus merdavium]|nr:Crp/Fnr family transcriptional regulator [Candidatus Merdenecus merdavium]